MARTKLFPAGVTTSAAGTRAAENLWLLRRYEPVLRFTQGELFLPMPVEDYLRTCSLWRTGAKRGRGRGGTAERLCAPGEVTPAHLAQIGAAGGDLSLRFAERALAQRLPGQFLVKLKPAIQSKENILPGEQLLAPVKRRGFVRGVFE